MVHHVRHHTTTAEPGQLVHIHSITVRCIHSITVRCPSTSQNAGTYTAVLDLNANLCTTLRCPCTSHNAGTYTAVSDCNAYKRTSTPLHWGAPVPGGGAPAATPRMKNGNVIACYLVIGELHILHASSEKRDLLVKAVLSVMKTSRAIHQNIRIWFTLGKFSESLQCCLVQMNTFKELLGEGGGGGVKKWLT